MAHETKADAHGAHGADPDGAIGHALSPALLIGIWLGLMFFTFLTVFMSEQGLGPQASFIVAMVIATIKAGLVMSVFMHLWWDKRMNLFVFLGSFLFVMLFIGMLLTDKSEYKPDIDRKTADDLAKSLAP